MIIHLEVEWDDAILERFALVIAQQSLHFALQLNWILQGAMQDYQPELPPSTAEPGGDDEVPSMGGTPNPNYNPVFYRRCLQLLRNVERCVVYGKPRAAALQRLYEQGKITKKELFMLEHADRRFNALQITAASNERSNSISAEHAAPQQLDGWIEVQMPTVLQKKSNAKKKKKKKNASDTPEFVSRFCSLDKHVFNCYKKRGCLSRKLKLDRAMSLERCTITLDDNSPNVLRVQTRAYQFRLRFESPEETNLWMRRMTEESDTTSLFQQSLHLQSRDLETDDMSSSSDPQSSSISSRSGGKHPHRKGETSLKQDLTPAQLERYEFFQNERLFVQALTDLADELRDFDRDERKRLSKEKVAKLQIPPTAVYLPLCNSSDIWRRVTSALPHETRVFSTKERCPVIMNFVTSRGEWHKRTNGSGALRILKTDPNLDVAEYMHSYLEVNAALEGVVEMTEEEETAEEPIEVGLDGPTDGGTTIDVSEHGSVKRPPNIWQEEEDHEPPTPYKAESTSSGMNSPQRVKGNRRVQRLLRESVVFVPKKLASRLNRHTRRMSYMDRQTELQAPVPIIDGSRKEDADNASTGDGSVVSIECSSILVKDQILFGDLDEGDIDFESIDRAKKFVSGGVSWAEKSAAMLEKAIKESEGAFEDNVQLEISSCLAKSNDDLRQEVFVMQMIHYYKSVFAKANLPLFLKTYRILSTSSSTGLLEVLNDATSLDSLKKSEGYPKEGLRKYFEIVYGGPKSKAFEAAQKNFMQSLAGYAVVSYLLGLKDRHNGNIMIDTRGHLINIDFGFAMGMAPGHEFSFECAPFKLTKEYVEVMGGVGSECYMEFERLFVAGMEVARKNSQIALGMVEIMMYKSNYPCFSGWRYGKGRALKGFEKRLMLRVPDKHVKRKAMRLVRKARKHFGTFAYDKFQLMTNGYAM